MLFDNAKDVMAYHKDRIAQAIFDIFPNIGFDKAKYQTGVLWQTAKERRRFFEEFAKENNFDPLVPANWYKISRDAVMERKGVTAVLEHHKNNVSTALIDLFPNIGLEKSKLLPLSRLHDLRYRRRILEDYAKEQNFDPANPNNWYSKSSITFLKNSAVVQIFYQGDVTKALKSMFPNTTWDESKLNSLGSWGDAKKRREFFEEYARELGFDPKVPDNWYGQPRERIMSRKGAASIIHHHKSISKALLDLFPEIGLEKSKFWAKSLKNRTLFFINIAQDNKFNLRDPEQWYLIAPEKIMNYENADSVLYYHKNSIAQALLDIFPDIGLIKSVLFSHFQIAHKNNKLRKTSRA